MEEDEEEGCSRWVQRKNSPGGEEWFHAYDRANQSIKTVSFSRQSIKINTVYKGPSTPHCTAPIAQNLVTVETARLGPPRDSVSVLLTLSLPSAPPSPSSPSPLSPSLPLSSLPPRSPLFFLFHQQITISHYFLF